MLRSSGSLQSNEPLPKKVSTKDNGAMKEGVMEDTQRKGFVQAALDRSKKDIPTFGHQMSISGISYLIERLNYEQYLAVNEIGFGGFWAIRTNVISKSLGMWLLENYDYCDGFLNLLNHRILEFTKEDVHTILGLPMGPKKVMEGKTCDSCEKYIALLGSWRRRWGISSGAPKIGKMHDGILDRGDHGDEFKKDFVIYVEHVNLVIHKHGQLHLSKVINKLITIPVEGSSVSIPGMWLHTIMNLKVAIEFKLIILHMQKGRLLKAVDDEMTLSAKFKAFIQEQYLRLLRPIYCAQILMHPIYKLRMTVSETAKKFFQQEQQSRKAT
ncbi:hypothetical protein Cgig2_031758 [Carnegiea gigantea]|uniref:Uncharacterized protein n=1 Tax=Carnegiea gigantea TaxID=171969 RepID=A0A9Q1QMX6_9CARY|nr:hypothetical protein Cgig2_031758 [Carnegiea gigantea]